MDPPRATGTHAVGHPWSDTCVLGFRLGEILTSLRSVHRVDSRHRSVHLYIY